MHCAWVIRSKSASLAVLWRTVGPVAYSGGGVLALAAPALSVKTKRPSLRYRIRGSDNPGTRPVTRTIALHLLEPQIA